MFALLPTHAFGDYRRVYPSYTFDVASPWDVFEMELGAGSALDMHTARTSGRASLEFPCRGTGCGMDTAHGYGIPQRHSSRDICLNRRENRKKKLSGFVRCKPAQEVNMPKKVARKGSENAAKVMTRERRQDKDYYKVKVAQGIKDGLMLQIAMEPGIGKENVEVDIDQNHRLLTVSVKRNVPEYHTVRDVWGRVVARIDRGMTKQSVWNRNIRLDERVDLSTISAKMEENVLTLYAAFKKMDNKGPRRIPVEGGDISTGTDLQEEPQQDEFDLPEETKQGQEAMAIDQQVDEERMAADDEMATPEIVIKEKNEPRTVQLVAEPQDEERKSVTSADEELDGSIEDCEY